MKIFVFVLFSNDIMELENFVIIVVLDFVVMLVSIFDSKGKYIVFLFRGESVVMFIRENLIFLVIYFEVIEGDEG